jgi:carbamoyl-phosphate synthase small subunit
MTDPSYAKQVIAFTFPHIGNVGANDEDVEAVEAHALGCLVREQGPSNIAIAHRADGQFDLEKLQRMAAEWPGLEGMDLAKDVSRAQVDRWTDGKWRWGQGYELGGEGEARPHVVAVDYGNKRNIFRLLVEAGAQVTVVPASATFDEIMTHEPDGFFLSNGPGDPAATGEYAVPVIQKMLETKKPLFGICLGHQMLALAVGGRTSKMFQGHRGANHPVKRLEDGRVEITSMNHGFAVEREGLPENVRETHVSLFDGSNCGIELTDRPAFSVQYHPEASPGPMDSFYLFEKFVGAMK